MRGERILLAVCAVLAIVLARPYAGGWNDASRLAMAESVVDYGTIAIDHSIFVDVKSIDFSKPLPYPADRTDLLTHGTLDKLFIRGFYYSDKTPLPSLYLAGVYKLWRMAGGPTAAERADLFCRVLTWASSGLAFVFAVAGILKLGRNMGLNAEWRCGLAFSFAFGTMLLGYVGTVNGHIIQLAAAVWVFAWMVKLPNAERPVRYLVGIGLLLGVAFAADSSAGPTLGLCVTLGLLAMTRKPMTVVIVGIASLPFVIGHQAVNYAIGGSLAPANANPEYFLWEGSPFRSGNITGRWRHESISHFVIYLGDLLFGKQGFLWHQPPALFAALWAIPLARKLPRAERIVLIVGMVWCVSTLLLAGATSTNRSGQSLSIRWFLPFLAPAFVVLAVLIRDRSDLRKDFLAMSVCGLLIAIPSAYYGLWIAHLIPGYWVIVLVTMVTLISVRVRAAKSTQSPIPDRPKFKLPAWLKRRVGTRAVRAN